MAVFCIQTFNIIDGITRYQVDRYVNCIGDLRYIFILIYERHLSVLHSAVHLENGQRVYFPALKVAQCAETSPATALTS